MSNRKQPQPKRKARPKKKAAAKRKRTSKKSQPKKAAKKAAAGTSKNRFLDRQIYAHARARGTSKAASALLAGSKARTVAARTQAGTIIEADPIVLDLIEAFRQRFIIEEIKDPWEKSQAVMEQMLLHPEWRARGTATNFFAKVVGGYAPDKVEHSGNIETAAPGEIEKLSKEERAKLRALLGKRKK